MLLFPPQRPAAGAPGRVRAPVRRGAGARDDEYHADGFPELYRLSNLDENGKPNGKHPDKGTLAWHTDGSWRRVTGQATIIYGEIVPETRRRDALLRHVRRLRAARSPAWKARIANLRAVHNLDFSRTRRHGDRPDDRGAAREAPPVEHPIVRTHPETGRKCLYLGDHAEYIVGMPYDEGRALIEELNALAVHPDLTLRASLAAARADRLGQPLPDASRDAYDPAPNAASCAAAPCSAKSRSGVAAA